MPLYRDIIDRRHIEELYFCTHIIIPERGVNTYLEKRVHPIFSDTGELVNIAVVARDISQERNLYHEGKRNEEELRQANADSRMYESELSYLLENCKMRSWHTSFKTQKMTFFTTVNEENLTMDFSEFVNHIIDYEGHPLEKRVSDMEASFAQQPTSKLYKIRRLLGAKGDEWYMMNTVPQQSDNGEVEGCFGLMRNVTSLISVQEQLKRETERANDSGRLKSVFLANMTHEIRTPLNAIVGFSDVLTMVESTEEKREMVRVIMNNCDMLLRLINDILEISTMDSNAIALEPEDVDFSKAFDDICETLQQRVHESTVSFIRDNPYPHLFTYLDTRRVQQVITNFVTNAVKYTNSGYIKVGYRVVDCPPEGRDVRHPISEAEHALSATGLYIYCEDTGAGIPKEKQSSVFERFVKLNDYIQGTGLGLSICKAIINRANGRIDVYSEGEGRGSTFWIWMPCDLNFEPLEQQDSTCSHD
jgi:signal transduction histidine kinase